jgi:hypothetical protein
VLDLAAERERAGDGTGARRAYLLALEIAPIDPAALRAAASFDLSQGRIAEALPRLDRLAALQLESREWIFPLFVRLLDAGAELAAFDALAARPSPWVGAFIEHACAKSTEPRRLAAIMLKRSAAGRARASEVGCVTDRLRRAGLSELAYQVWLNTLARDRLADVGFVFNGGFEHAPSGVASTGSSGRRRRPMWSSTRSPKRRPRPPSVARDLQRQARDRPRDPPVPRGPAGRYELAGLARMESLQSVRGLQWVVRCEGADGRVSRSRPLRDFSARMPGSDSGSRWWCRRRARAGARARARRPDRGNHIHRGKAWFDDLRLARRR